MPLIRIQRDQGVKLVFIAGGYIADLASVELFTGERQVKMGATGDEHLAAGVSRGSALSGDLVRVIAQGIVSGVKIASGYTVAYGDRLTLATSGAVRPLNSITPTGAISGYITGAISGYVTVTGAISGYIPQGAVGFFSGIIASGIILSGYSIPLSGYVSIASGSIFSSGSLVGLGAFNSGSLAGKFNSGAFVGTAFNTGRILGRALTSGGSGMAAIQMMVCLE